MLSLKNYTGADNVCSYYVSESKLEYYAGKDQENGQWLGLEDFGIKNGSDVGLEAMQRLVAGQDPSTGKTLIQLQKNKSHRPGYDLTFSAPKSVSVMWGISDETEQTKILTAHRNAVKRALKYTEKNVLYTRRGHGGKKIELVRNGLWAQFDHSVSRENDPQLHTHNFLTNMAQRKDGTWGTIESSYFYREKMAIGAIYRSELAHELKKIGYQTERKDTSFEISGVPNEIIKEFSKRRVKILSFLEKKGKSGAVESEQAALRTRSKKTSKDLLELKEEWKFKCKEMGFDPKSITKGINSKEKKIDYTTVINESINELTEKKAVFIENNIRATVATRAQCIYNADEIEIIQAEAFKSPDLIRLNEDNKLKKYTTKEILEIETSLQETAVKMLENKDHVISRVKVVEQINKNPKLRDEQKRMIEYITNTDGAIKIAIGGAGSGKSYALGVVNEIYKQNKFNVIGLSPTGKAASELEKSANIKSSTIDMFLLKEQKINEKTILVVDEAGMVGSKKLKRLIDKTVEANAKIILVGDSKQLQPVEAGAPFRMLRDHIGNSSLELMERQEKKWQQEATKFFSQGKGAEALELYYKHNQLHIYKENTIEELSKKWVSDSIKDPLETRVALTCTNIETQDVNNNIRFLLKDKGILENSLETNVISNDRKTDKNIEIAKNDRIIFLKNNRKLDVHNGTLAQILSVTEKNDKFLELTVKTDRDKILKFDTKQYNFIDHSYAITVHKSQGANIHKTYPLISKNTSKELAYTALSRHIKDATIFIDRSSFAGELVLKGKAPEQNTERMTEIFDKTKALVAQKISIDQPKENALEVAKKEEKGLRI